MKSFGQAFLKACGFQRRRLWLATAVGENSNNTKSAGGEPKQFGGLFWRGEPSPGVPRCEAQIPQFSVKSANKKSSPKAKKQEKFLANKKMYNKTAGEQIVHQQMQLKSLLI